MSLLQFFAQTGRQWLEEEYEVARLHTMVGESMLKERASTRPYAAAALGHHAWYDGSAHGYPTAYRRLECPGRQMVDVVGLMDWLENVTGSGQASSGIEMSFDEAVEEAVALEGRRFSPLLTARLRDKRVTDRICQAFQEGRREADRSRLAVQLQGQTPLDVLPVPQFDHFCSSPFLSIHAVLLDAAPAVEALGGEGLAALIQGFELALYRQENWKQEKKEDKAPDLWLTGTEGVDAEKILAETGAMDRWVCFARDLANRPGNKLTPDMLAKAVTGAVGNLPVEAQVLDENETRALGMEAFHAVGDSSANPPRLIVLRYRGGKEGDAPIVLVGKGVCFDSGGYSLKRSMRGMKGDMAGGAAVCGAILALAENRVPVNVTAVIPAVENRISPASFLPDDVIGSMSGKTNPSLELYRSATGLSISCLYSG